VVFRDDALVVDAAMRKAYGPMPGVHVRVWPRASAALTLVSA
jgi:Holliday junction resolvase RusA-like endonuclease